MCYEFAKEVIEGLGEVLTKSAVDGRDLDDGAARGDQPVEAFAEGEGGNGAGIRGAFADPEDAIEVVAEEVERSRHPQVLSGATPALLAAIARQRVESPSADR